jgi:hypothetical protein
MARLKLKPENLRKPNFDTTRSPPKIITKATPKYIESHKRL